MTASDCKRGCKKYETEVQRFKKENLMIVNDSKECRELVS